MHNTKRMRRRCFIRPQLLLFPCFLVFVGCLLVYIFTISNNCQILDLENISQLARRTYKTTNTSINTSFNDQSTCILPTLDEWDPEIQRRMPRIKPFKNECSPSIFMMTSLNNGTLTTNSGIFSWSPSCFYRCLRPIDDYNMTVDDWSPIDNVNGIRPECDIIEVECKKYFWFNYKFIHTQIVEKNIDYMPKNPETLSLYWIMMDSVSSSMFKRAMVNTRKILINKLHAIEFSYLNKIPLNTRPNAYALFFGEQAYRLTSDPFNQQSNQTIQTGKHIDELCKTELDGLKFIGYDFKNAGYHTFMTEDWALGVINWPNCIGFKKPPVDHFFRPFWLKMDGEEKDIDRRMRSNMFKQSCKNYHNYDMEQLLMFADSYKGKPKFGLTWITYLAHDDNSVLFEHDHEFADFFEQLSHKSKDSFIIFQSDHGIRTGPIRDLPIIGEVEDNNPFLYMIVPERLRSNPTLMKQIQENSQHLVTQFDLYASVVQLAKFGHEWNSKTKFDQQPKQIEDRQLIGSSIFHQMIQPRSCNTLRISFDFCICYQESVDLNDPGLARRVAQTIVDSINKQLEDSEYKDMCSRHTLSPTYPIRLEEFPNKDSKPRMLKAKFETMPGQALYQGFVQMNPDSNLSLLQRDFARLNMYVDQAHCIPESFYKNYCVC